MAEVPLDDEVFQKVHRIVCDHFKGDRQIDIATINRDTRLKDDLNADSLDYMEVVMKLEEEFRVDIANSVRDNPPATLAELCRMVAEAPKSKIPSTQ